MDKKSRYFHSSFRDEASTTSFRTKAWRDGVATRAEELSPLQPTLLHAFADAAQQPVSLGVTLVADDGESETHRSYRELYHQAMAMGALLSRLGIGKGDRVLLVLPTSFEFLVSFFAIQMAGAVPVPSYPPSGLRVDVGVSRLTHIANHSGARLCITTAQIRPFLGQLAAGAPKLDGVKTIAELAALDAAPAIKPSVFTDDPAFIQYTSGSTDRPKGVLLLHRNLVANLHAIGQALRVNRHDTVVSWLPLYHDMGLIGTLLFSIYWRVPLVMMSPTAFLLRPSRWLWTIHRHRGTLSPAPNFAYALCVRRVKEEERQGLDLSSWRSAMNGAEPIDFRTVVDFTTTYNVHGFRPAAMLPVYGLAESSLAVAFPDLGWPPRHLTVNRAELANGHVVPAHGRGSVAVVSVGRPVPGHEVLVVGEEEEELDENEVGHVVVKGPSIMSGYFEDPAATASVMRDGWLWTGDLGFYREGQLYITGRFKDLIILRGRNVYAEDLERVAERIDGVRPGGAFAFGIYDEDKATERVVMLVETRAEDEQARAELVKSVTQKVIEFCDVRIDEVVLVAPRTLPRTSSGKKQRALARTRYLSDELAGGPSGKLALAMTYVRSRSGYLYAAANKLLKRKRREPL